MRSDRLALPLVLIMFLLAFGLFSGLLASSISLGGDLAGVPQDARVTGIQMREVATTQPSNNQCYVWNASNERWQPGDCGAGEGIENAWVHMTAGSNTASATGADTFLFLSDGASALSVGVSAASKSVDYALTTSPSMASTVVGTLREVISGTGLDGGGNLSANRTLSITESYRIPQTCTDGQMTVWNNTGSVWECDDVPAGNGNGGASDFTDLDDTPGAYTGAGGFFVAVNSGATALEFLNPASVTIDAGQVTSGAFDDARVAESNVTQHEGALTITESQISDLSAYIDTAGRSLTKDGSTVNADEPLYTVAHSFHWPLAATTSDDNPQWLAPHAMTITRVDCSTNTGTVTIQLEERTLTTPNSAGTDILTSSLVCDSNNETTTSFDNASIAANALVSLTVSAFTGEPTMTRIHFRGTYDD